MFFKRKESPSRRRAVTAAKAPTPLSPRFARLVRESWWLLVVAAFLWLALVLASYTRTDPGWSYSGAGAPIGNTGGVVGAWVADLLLYLFGFSAWWWVVAGVVLVVAGFRRVLDPERETDHPLGLAVLGFVLVLFASAALEAIRVYRLPVSLPLAPGGAMGDLVGRGLARAIGFNGATLALLALFAVGCTLLFGVSWLKVAERIGATLERGVRWLRRRAEERQDRLIGEQAAAFREAIVEQQRDETPEREPIIVVPPVVEVPKSPRAAKERQRPLFQELPDSPLPPLALLDDAPAASDAMSAARTLGRRSSCPSAAARFTRPTEINRMIDGTM